MSPKPSIEQSLDQHRQSLEDSITKLRSALDKRRTYSAEYEAFREELQALPPSASREDMLAAGPEIEGAVVDVAELQSLLGGKAGIRRNREQVLTAVKHRINYVDENITKVEKQLYATEEKLDKLLVISEPDAKTEDGLRIMDIHEMLDEDGNVIGATINGKDPKAIARSLDSEALGHFEKFLENGEQKVQEGAPEVEDQSELPAPKPTAHKEVPKLQPAPITDDDDDGEFMKDESGGFVKVLDDPEEPKAEDWVCKVPGESEEDARLRREMINYSMQEIGAVVAEINLEESGDFHGYEEYTDDETEEVSDEDGFGRTTSKVVSDSYRREMEELERIVKKRQGLLNDPSKKGVRFADDLDISPTPPPPPTVEEIPPNADIAPADEDALPFLAELMARSGMTNVGPTIPASATELEPVPYPVVTEPRARERGVSIFKKENAAVPPQPKEPSAVPTFAVADSVLERPPVANTIMERAPPPPALEKKLSRFAAAASAAPTQEPTPPTRSVVAHSILERPPTVAATPPSAPDELDPVLHRQEVAASLLTLRDKIMKQQGGYPEDDGGMVPINEEEVPKVSRFKQRMERRLPGM